MSYKYKKYIPRSFEFKHRSQNQRKDESIWQHHAIGNIENFLSRVNWNKLGKTTDLSGVNRDIRKLRSSNDIRHRETQANKKGLGNLKSWSERELGLLTKRLDNWDTTTDVGEVVGLDKVLGNLKKDYQSDIKGVETQLGDYLKTGDFNTRMTDNLDALGQTLRGEFGEQIGSLDIEGVRKSIQDQGGDLSTLTEDFAGISKDVDWLKGLDLGGLDDRLSQQGTNFTNLINQQGSNFQDQLTNQQTQFKGDLTDLQNILESGRGEALANLESAVGKDRAADLLNLRQQLEEGRLSDIQGMAGNLRQEFGDQVFDLSDTFDQRLGDVQTALGGDISKLFKESGSLQSGIDTLTSGLGTTTQQLESLRDSFGDYKTDAATNLANVEKAFGKEVGDLGTEFTGRLSDLRSDLDTSWTGKLEEQNQKFQDQFRQGESDLNKRLSDISSSMNYRMLGDSAQGVKIRRSRAYNQGKTRSGTGQLGRSMKISTLNI